MDIEDGMVKAGQGSAGPVGPVEIAGLVADLGVALAAARKRFGRVWVSVEGSDFEGGLYDRHDSVPVASAASRATRMFAIDMKFVFPSTLPAALGGPIAHGERSDDAVRALNDVLSDLAERKVGIGFGRFLHPYDVLCRVAASSVCAPEGPVLVLHAVALAPRPSSRHLRDHSWP